MKPYADNFEHLLDELSRIDRLIRNYLKVFQAELSEPMDEFRGLYISEAEIQSLLKSQGLETGRNILPDFVLEENEAARRDINNRKVESLKCGRELRLQILSELFNLDPFEIDVLLIGLAPELDLKYEKLYSYLQNDVTKKKPTLDTALAMLFPTIEEKIKARAYFSPAAPLRKNHMIHLLEGEENIGLALISSFIKIDERIINFLLGSDEPDMKIKNFLQIIIPKKAFEDLILPSDFKSKLMNMASWYSGNKFPLKLLFCGPPGSGKKTAAEAFCREAGKNLLIVDSKILLEGRSSETADLIMREAILQNSALYLQAFDELLEDKEPKNPPEFLIQAFKMFPGLIFLAGNEYMELDKGLINNGFVPFSFPLPSYYVRKQLWESCLNNYKLAEGVNLNALASKFRFTGGQIRDAAFTAFSFAGGKNPSGSVLSMEDLYKGCKAQSNQKLNSLAMKTNLHYTWEDIVLPKSTMEHLKEVSGFIKYKGKVHSDWGFENKLSLGKGLNVLFSGPSGTGKTMAAEILANEVKLDLYKIDLSSMVSKYIGETEKNLKKVFEEAETSNSILFFDEADALFGKRSEVKDSHDRYANIEINYLLQKMEEYEGVVILASNFRKNIDEAFLRRLHFIIEFPIPDEKYREKIWKNVFPEEMPVDNDIDFVFLSRFKITGGNIKNIALSAAFLAADDCGLVMMKHIIRAARREFQKMGKLSVRDELGKYYQLLEEEMEDE
jgi:SpoVK/Ycf46/Vps4 family AAA+-type ATPase